MRIISLLSLKCIRDRLPDMPKLYSPNLLFFIDRNITIYNPLIKLPEDACYVKNILHSRISGINVTYKLTEGSIYSWEP